MQKKKEEEGDARRGKKSNSSLSTREASGTVGSVNKIRLTKYSRCRRAVYTINKSLNLAQITVAENKS